MLSRGDITQPIGIDDLTNAFIARARRSSRVAQDVSVSLDNFGGPFPVFVKPADEAKAFDGQVLSNESDLRKLLLPRPGFPTLSGATRVQAQEVVQLASEWRVFVVRARIHSISHFAGDPLLFPSAKVVRLALGSYTPAPGGYAADFAVTLDGQTILVEVNDGWSLGHGGLPPDTYVSLLDARWRELTSRGERA